MQTVQELRSIIMKLYRDGLLTATLSKLTASLTRLNWQNIKFLNYKFPISQLTMNELLGKCQKGRGNVLTIMKLLNILWLCLLSLLTLLPMYDSMFVVVVVVLSQIAIQAIRNIVSLSGWMCG